MNYFFLFFTLWYIFIFFWYIYWCITILVFNSLWSSETIWCHRSGSTLAQVTACCLTAPGRYRTQCFSWSSCRCSFKGIYQFIKWVWKIYLQNYFYIYQGPMSETDFYLFNRFLFVGFNHGLPWCVKYMARGTPVTTKPDGEAGGFCGDRRPEGHVFYTSRQAMIKTYYSTSIRKKYGTKLQLLYTNKVNNDGNRRQQSTTEQDWAWLFSGSDGTPNFDF